MNEDDDFMEEVVIDTIGKIALNLRYMKWEHNELQQLTRLKKLVDSLYKRYGGKE